MNTPHPNLWLSLVLFIACVMLISASLDTDELSLSLPLKLHTTCRKDYTNQLRIKTRKREIDNPRENIGSPPPKLRSTESPFNIKENCLFCTKLLVSSQKINISSHNTYSNVETIEFLKSLTTKAQERNDEWGEPVLRRTNGIFDLVAAEAKYHIFMEINKNPLLLTKRRQPRVDHETSKQKMPLKNYVCIWRKMMSASIPFQNLKKEWTNS